MEINGVLLDIDFTDADILQRIEEGSKKVYEEADKVKDTATTPAEGIRQECKILKDFLDYVFGDGTSQKLFGNKDSLNQCLNAFQDIINARDNQMIEINQKFSKYSPERLKR